MQIDIVTLNASLHPVNHFTLISGPPGHSTVEPLITHTPFPDTGHGQGMGYEGLCPF